MTGIYALVLFHCLTYTAATRVLGPPFPSATPVDQRIQERLWTEEGIAELALQRVVRRRSAKRDEVSEAGTSAVGLGDALDVTYNVLVQVGDIATPLVLDTGSADLWVLSDTCSTCSNSPYPLYPSEIFESVADARLLYGDSRTGTHAYGLIGSDRSGIAGLSLGDQYFAAINDTNTSVLDTGSAGIFGLGFPVNSLLWNELYTIAASGLLSSTTKRHYLARVGEHSGPRSLPSPSFPSIRNLAVGDNVAGSGSANSQFNILSSFSTYGPLVSRLVLNSGLPRDDNSPSFLASPQFTVTLQRTTPAPGGNIGSLTLGALPSGIDNASLAWVPVRRYTEDQNGVVVPQAPEETYPYAWDIPLDAVYFDGVHLPNSGLGDVSAVGVGQSALVDTGNSLIRGPADVVVAILSLLANSTSSPSPFSGSSPLSQQTTYSAEEYAEFTHHFDPVAYAYPCAEAHSLSFEFSGKQFQVDPRDFLRPLGDPDALWCVPNLAPTDPPQIGGYLYSWSLGEPFLRGVLSSFYYGNLTHPSNDLPRIGFLSTVPNDATLRLSAAVQSAQSAGGYPTTTVLAPNGTYSNSAVTTNRDGVVQASEPVMPFDLDSTSTSGVSPHNRQGSAASCLLRSTFGAKTWLHGNAILFFVLALVGAWLFL